VAAAVSVSPPANARAPGAVVHSSGEWKVQDAREWTVC
jgi:hypothetical protein